MQINGNYHQLADDYLFATIANKVADYSSTHSETEIIRLGIGDVTRPLCEAVVEALRVASVEMGSQATFRGYGPYQGYGFLRSAICGYYRFRGVCLNENEVFVSDGAKSDIANILDIFSVDNTVLIPNPVYPVYVDTNIMAGRRIHYLDSGLDNDFLPLPDPKVRTDIIYLCSPNNPTGAVYTKDGLRKWVEYANDQHAVILFDAAYEAFVRDKSLPCSIYEIPGAETCAIEFCSLSKTAGFTGTRCGYTVIPAALKRGGSELNRLWLRRQTTKYNCVPYIVQRGAAAVFTRAGQTQVTADIDYYMENARLIATDLRAKGIPFTGGENSPYIWLQCPDGRTSWEYFDYLLNQVGVVGTPGAGFGEGGEGFFRLTAFGTKEATLEALRRMDRLH